MKDLAVFSVSSQKLEWLSVRGREVASNIANANTPGFKARDVVPFAEVVEQSGSRLMTTNSHHIGAPGEVLTPAASDERASATISGNTVVLEEELLKISSVRSEHGLATGVVSAFNRMLLNSVRG